MTNDYIPTKKWVWRKFEVPANSDVEMINQLSSWTCPFCNAPDNCIVDITEHIDIVDNLGRKYRVHFTRFCPSCQSFYIGEWMKE